MIPLSQSLMPIAAETAKGIGWNMFWYIGIAYFIIFCLAVAAKGGLHGRVFTAMPARLAEHLYLFLESMAISVIGPKGRKYVPLLYSLWLYIFVGNVMILFLPHSPTADWSLNISLAIITMCYVQYEGIRANGLLGHLKHFAGPIQAGGLILINVLLFGVELISEAMKLFSLSIRLFGNIYGGHVVVDALNSIVKFGDHEIPLGGLILPIKFFTCLIQAYVFCILTCTYLSVVSAHDDEHGGDHGDQGEPENMHVDPHNGRLTPDRERAAQPAHA